MTLTEPEAREKWCPMVRFTNTTGRAPSDGDFCIASRCMMWRWGQIPNPEYRSNMAYQVYPPPQTPMFLTDTERGFCGLAGRP